MLDTMFFTKVIAAFCGALLVLLLGKWMADELLMPANRTAEAAYVVDTGVEDEGEAEAAPTFAQAFRVASAADGERLWSQCRACHSLDEGSNGLGPYLYNVVGREIEAVDGFNYSGALPEGQAWTPELLSEFLESPRSFAPGTSMAYNGMSSVQDRANMIAYLIDNSPDYEAAEMDAAELAEPEAEVGAEAAVAGEAAAGSDIVAAFAQADAAAGQQLWRQCMACHVADAETNRVGPHLVGIIGREIGSIEDFRYSGNLPEGTWTLEELAAFIENPRDYAPGTTMAYNGLSGTQQKANLLAYIDSINP